MPPRKTDSAAENLPPPEEKTPTVSRADVHGEARAGQVAPEPTPLGDDQVEVELPDGSTAVVDRIMADAMAEAKKKTPESVKQFPPSGAAGEEVK